VTRQDKDRIHAYLSIDFAALDYATLWDYRCQLQDDFKLDTGFNELDKLVAVYSRIMDELKRRYPNDIKWPLVTPTEPTKEA